MVVKMVVKTETIDQMAKNRNNSNKIRAQRRLFAKRRLSFSERRERYDGSISGAETLCVGIVFKQAARSASIDAEPAWELLGCIGASARLLQ